MSACGRRASLGRSCGELGRLGRQKGKDKARTQLLVLVDGLLLTDLEALGRLGVEVVVISHCCAGGL